jgi:mannan endo-1,4-beta-mannosidase
MKRNNFFPTGPAFDGSFGVDTEDITSIPTIDFGTLFALTVSFMIGFSLMLCYFSQLFPDQVQYYPVTPSNQTIAKLGTGSAWTVQHSSTANMYV